MKQKKIKTDNKQRAIELRADGLTYRAIAKELGISTTSVADIIKENIEAVTTLENIRLETLYKSALVTHEARVEALGALRVKLMDEVKARNLADVPTKDLITLLLNTNKAIREEVQPLEILSTYEQEQRKENRDMCGFAFGD